VYLSLQPEEMKININGEDVDSTGTYLVVSQYLLHLLVSPFISFEEIKTQ